MTANAPRARSDKNGKTKAKVQTTMIAHSVGSDIGSRNGKCTDTVAKAPANGCMCACTHLS